MSVAHEFKGFRERGFHSVGGLSPHASAGGSMPQASDVGSGSALDSFLGRPRFDLGASFVSVSATSTGVSMTLPPITVRTIFVGIEKIQLLEA